MTAAVTWLWTVGQAQVHNRILELFHNIYSYATPECPNLVEINVTGGSRFFFTREPEHVKTVLTSKFAEYGKGPEFHRVWVSPAGLFQSRTSDYRERVTNMCRHHF